MNSIFFSKTVLFAVVLFGFGGCAYFNTFYNAQQYFEEAEKIRLQKEGESIPITAMDKYGKTIEKCEKVLLDYPETRFRTEVILLKAKAQFYRKDYDLAISDLKIVTDDGNEKQIGEAQYWRALCKWKKGNSQTGINELTNLLESSKSEQIISQCHLYLAEIFQELKDSERAMMHLQEGAKLAKNRDQKGVIYVRLAEMAFNREKFDIAKKSYENVIAHSLSKEKIENAHLQILKILRNQKNYRSASRKIKGMLTDDKFKNIAGNLELELVQLYRAQGETEEIETRLESIVNDYQRTTVSAEAYYMLGQIYTSKKWDLNKAKEYFDLVSKESSRSLFAPLAKSRSKAIDMYQKALTDLDIHSKIESHDTILLEPENDSLIAGVSTDFPDRTVAELYYQLADLEAFSFNRYEQGIQFLTKIISNFPESPYRVKSMFAMVFIYENMGDTLKAIDAKEIILKTYPNSEYAAYLSGSLEIEVKEQEKLFEKAESQITDNPDNAVQLFKELIRIDKKSDLAVSAAYTISYHYDHSAKIDSAIKYYSWIQENHPRSDQSIQAEKRMQNLQLAMSIVETESDSTTIIQEEN